MRENILIFGHSYATQFIDINNQYTTLFDPKKFSVTVVYLTGKSDEEIKKRHLAKEIIFLDASTSTTRGLKISIIKKMLQLHREKNFRLAICHRYKPSYVMMLVSLFKKIPLIFSIMHELGTLKNFSRKFLIAAFAKENMIFAGVSDAVRNDLRKNIWHVPEERVITLHNGIDVNATEQQLLTRENARKEFSLTENEFVFGTIGRLAKNKDQHTLLHAFAAIKKPAKLLIIGDGALEKDLKDLTKELKIENDVIFTGFLPHAFRYLKAFDVYISSSIQEAFGLVLLEAMLARIPIIATRVNGVPEVMGDTGILIPAQDQNKMTTEMLKLYSCSSDERKKLGQQGYERAVNNFSFEQFHKLFWNLSFVKETFA